MRPTVRRRSPPPWPRRSSGGPPPAPARPRGAPARSRPGEPSARRGRSRRCSPRIRACLASASGSPSNGWRGIAPSTRSRGRRSRRRWPGSSGRTPPWRAGSSTSAGRCGGTSTSLSTASSASRTRRSARTTESTSCRRSREDERDMTELVVGTKKGLFVLEGEPGSTFEVTARAFAGEPVEYALRDPRSGRVLAAVSSPFYGPKIFHADDPSGEWEQAAGVALPEGGEQALERIWVLVPGEAEGLVYAGGA